MGQPNAAHDHDAEHAHAEVHGHEHEHEHEHAHGGAISAPVAQPAFSLHEQRQARRLTLVIALVAVFFVVQFAGAILAESVVLQADALHLLMDVLALTVSLFAMRLAVRKPTRRFTFGLRRAEPVAAIFSAVLVLVTTVLIVIEGIEALRAHAPPKAGIMLVVALLAVLVNGVSAWLLHDVAGHAHPGDGTDGDHSHDGSVHAKTHANTHANTHAHAHPTSHAKAHGHALNLRGAWLHLAGDALGAVAALIAALIIRFGGDPAADPIASFVVAAILVVGSIRLLRDATLVLLEAAPPHLPVAVVGELVSGFPGVAAVRELHVWTLGAGHDAITVHVRPRSVDPSLGERLSARLRAVLGAEYVTVQVDSEGDRHAELETPVDTT